MPGGDGTGPYGTGGWCTPLWTSGQIPRPLGFYGRGFGRGRGSRGWFYATGMPGWVRAQQGLPAFGSGLPAQPVTQQQPIQFQQPSKEQEVQMLEQQQKAIEEEKNLIEKEIENIKKRIEELKK